MNGSHRGIRVWVNVTTSSNWTRPAVGIVRVEQALATHLRTLLGEDCCRLCTWKDGRFMEYVAPDKRARELPHSSDDAPIPLQGDILVSVGLDWDHPYSAQFHTLAKLHGLRIVSCCYDLIPLLFPQTCVAEVARKFSDFFIGLNWAAEAVLCISDQTRVDYARVCEDLCAPPRRTVVIPLGDNLPPAGTDIGPLVSEILQIPFLLYVSTIERRKNHEVLHRAYHLMARHGLGLDLPKLVFVGMQGWGVGDLMHDIEFDPLTRGKIVVLNDVTDGELGLLYRKALFCLFPSLYEGWGLPVAEALAMGKAVIASREGAIRAIGGDLVRYVPAWNAYAWADAIHDYIRNPHSVAAVENRVKATYVPRRWEDTAAVVASLIEEMTAQPGNAGRLLELLPGYDMSTQCGIHWGAAIRTSGAGGMLLYGPYIPLRAGNYRVKVLGNVLPGHSGHVRLEVTSDYARTAHVADDLRLAAMQEGVLADCVFELHRYADHVEIRCLVESECALHLDTVRIERVGAH